MKLMTKDANHVTISETNSHFAGATLREKEVRLLHLDNSQRSALNKIIDSFVKGNKPKIDEIVEAFNSYVIYLLQLHISGDEKIHNGSGILTSYASEHLKKFSDAIFILSKYTIYYNKILTLPDIQTILIKASGPINKLSAHYINELTYKLKIATYKSLEVNNNLVGDYIDGIKDFYFRSMVSVNKPIALRAFIDQIVSMLNNKNGQTISDIHDAISKYASYLGDIDIDPARVEALIYKYGHSSNAQDGALYAAKIEVFKILEGL